MPSLKRPNPVLPLSHIQSRGLPVIWLWSKTTLLVIPGIVFFLHTGHCHTIYFGFIFSHSCLSLALRTFPSIYFLQSTQDGLLTLRLFFPFWFLSNNSVLNNLLHLLHILYSKLSPVKNGSKYFTISLETGIGLSCVTNDSINFSFCVPSTIPISFF